ncbi:MAG: F0F1 ATP synthase subunit delta [Acidiferrobacterales bacterium]|nr:F0F1 ATP synthase subunit delta [Acidiferrobacterales bacterium]
MAEIETLARPYAEAVFALAKEQQALPKWSQMLGLLAEVASDERVAALAVDPRVNAAQLTGLLLDIGGASLSEDAKNLVRLLVENDRVVLLPAIAAQFERLKADAEGVVDVEAIAAFELNSNQIKQIAQSVQQKLGREVTLHTSVDKTLIGGVIIRAGDLVIDGSVRGHLYDLAAQLDQ